MQIFDEKIKFVPRRQMPEVLCIDEIKFQTAIDRKYVCILYDFYRREIVDIIISPSDAVPARILCSYPYLRVK